MNSFTQIADSNSEIDSRCISIIESCGFITRSKNSFDQFCINYINEKLFKLHSDFIVENLVLAGISESIKNSHNERYFEPVPTCLEIIEGRNGILSIINEETNRKQQNSEPLGIKKLCSMLKGIENENTFKSSSSSTRFKIHNPKTSNVINVNKEISAFEITHYFGNVTYSIEGFLDKNKDFISKNSIELLSKSKSRFISHLAIYRDESKGYGKTADNFKSNRNSFLGYNPSHVFELKKSIDELDMIFESTNNNFIHCVNPNRNRNQNLFDKEYIVEQLKMYHMSELIISFSNLNHEKESTTTTLPQKEQ
ncbi:Myosin-52 [Smittium culicis]|uniref:Myosin-52 n=1 Tax=Smittium culicis TaxID=133412 RepID=A0A1R1XU00_9FUNG|nr:Myosin-52 [Smittium culicis]OMJ18094.1 Myosin-52 [Smittium culicis]